jgi:lipopolysaccharide/colanic/teichoic acid biosynthesis glycosyltransferase
VSGTVPLETVRSAPTRRSAATDVAARARDIVVSAVLLVLLAPVFLAVTAAVGVSSGGPIFFRQSRVGRGRRPFVMLKFRTMVPDCDDRSHREFVEHMFANPGTQNDSGPQNGLWKLDDDERVTRVGRVLRQLSLDELPQLMNVVAGSMSLVGPRPPLPWEVQLFDERHLARFDVLPGMTGLWQVSGRSSLTMPEALDLDVEYVERRNFWLDLRILVRTLPVVLSGRGAS